MTKIKPEVAMMSETRECLTVKSQPTKRSWTGLWSKKVSHINCLPWNAIGRDSFKDHGTGFWRFLFWCIVSQMFIIRLLTVIFSLVSHSIKLR